ncbi:MAG: ROK family protein, partial [Bacteroidota bacterium]
MQHFWGIDLGGSKMHLEAEALDLRWKTGIKFGPKNLQVALREALSQAPTPPTAIGLSIPGLVKDSDEVVATDVLPELNGLKAAELDLGIPLYFIHDLKAATHQTLALYPETKLPVCVMVGTGIAMGWATQGQVQIGAHGWAGEMGSMVMESGPQYRNLDQLAAGAGILRQWQGDVLSLAKALGNADLDAVDLIKQAGSMMGRGLSHLIHLYNPDLILCGGGTLQYSGYVDAMLESARACTLPPMWEACKIKIAAQDANLVGKGAAQ